MTEALQNVLDVPDPLTQIDEFGDFVMQNDSFNASMFLNSMLGIGDPKYDSSASDDVIIQSVIPESLIVNIYRNSTIARNIVNTYPNEASFGHPIFTGTKYRQYGADPVRLEMFVSDALERGKCPSLESLFRSASRSARLMGVSYLVLGFDDGNNYSDPLEEENIRSLDWIIQKSKLELTPDNILNPQIYTFSNRYDFYDEPKILESKIHASRVLKFVGVSEVNEILETFNHHDSILQTVFKALIRDEKGIELTNQMLVKKVILWAKLKLAQASTSEQKKALLGDRLRYINLVSSIYRMIGLNENEELGSNQIDLGNVDKVLAANVDRLVAASNLNRFKILGTPASEGLGQSSRGLENRLDFSQRSHSFCVEYWKDHLLRIYRLACKVQGSPTNGKLPSGLDIEFPTNLQIFPDEWGELRKNNSDWAEKLVNLGVISKTEVRLAFFGATGLEAQLIPNIVLNEDFTKKLEESDLKESEEMPKAKSENLSEEDLGQKDSDPIEPKNKSRINLSSIEKALQTLSEVTEDDLDRSMEDLVR
jgi:hypothetical protein